MRVLCCVDGYFLSISQSRDSQHETTGCFFSMDIYLFSGYKVFKNMETT